MIVAMALIVFSGIAPAENSNTSAGAETVQNSKSHPRENSIENTSFEIKVLHGNERLKLPEKNTVCIPQERGNTISLPAISQSKKGLRVSSFIRNATGNISGVINVPQSSVTEGWEPSKLPPSADLLKLGEEVALVGSGRDDVPGTS